MKKLITLILVLTGMVSTAMAEGLTIYLDATGFLSGNNDEAFAVWNHSNSSFIKFTNISDNYYKADLPDGYTGINLVRYDKNQEPSWTAKWNQTGNLTPSAENNYFIVTGLSGDNCPCTTTGAHKVYVKNMESTDAINFYAKEKTGWTEINGSEPGTAMTEETIGDETWYSYLNLSNKDLYAYFSIEAGDHNISGFVNPDLKTSDKYYYYYPSKYQAVLNTEALATPATVHFRASGGKEGENLKWYMWNSDGINSSHYSTETVGGVEWVTFETYKSSFSFQLYTFNDGDDDSENDKSYGADLTFTAGENSYYFTGLPRKNIEKIETNYSIAYWTDASQWLGNGISVSSIEMDSNEDFKFKATIDNSEGGFYRYCITPTSNIVDGKIVAASKTITPNSGNFDVNGFENHESEVTPGRWAIININNVPAKFNLTFNSAAMYWTSKPYREATIGEAGYITYSNGEKCTVSGAEAIYVVSEINTNSVKLEEKEESTVWPASEGMILKGKNGDKITINAVAWDAATTAIGTNYLVGSGNSTLDVEVDNPNDTKYVFATGTSGVGFYKAAETGTLAAHKAYLDLGKNVEQGEPTAREFLGFAFEGETTGISATLKDNGEMTNDKVIFDLQGRKVSNGKWSNGQMPRGLYIVNGKKYVVK